MKDVGVKCKVGKMYDCDIQDKIGCLTCPNYIPPNAPSVPKDEKTGDKGVN